MRAIIIGLDAFEPARFERLFESGRVPHLAKYVERKSYARFTVANPPQSEVSWTSIATGLNPGGHGLFDFVHRDPASYALNVSLLPTKKTLGGTQFAEPFNAKTIFDQAVAQGYQATALFWPGLFPARVKSPVRSIPGLGTPDLLGRWGVGTLFTTDKGMAAGDGRKTPVALLEKTGRQRYQAALNGPLRKVKGRVAPAQLTLNIDQTGDRVAKITLDNQVQLELPLGVWSPILELKFKLGFLISAQAITRLIVTRLDDEVAVYLLPLQLHPLHPIWHYGTPKPFVKESWQQGGPFLTVGWPQDTTALEDGFISDEQFIRLCEDIIAVRERILMHHLGQFNEGVLACVFDTLDRMQHMFWRDRPELIDEWYVRLDALVGRVEEKIAQRGLKNKVRLIIVSDHGFAPFDHKAHLNRWLMDHGYLQAKEGQKSSETLAQVDWSQTKAYAIGLNSLYINLTGREGKGIVAVEEKEAFVRTLCDQLQQWQGGNGAGDRRVVQQVWRQEEAFDGPLSAFGPDIMVGFAPGFRASSETGLGGWAETAVTPNNDHWGADHCMDPNAVPGVIFSSHGLGNFPHPSYRDIPFMSIGVQPDDSGVTPPPTSSGGEDEATIEERLKSLGYL